MSSDRNKILLIILLVNLLCRSSTAYLTNYSLTYRGVTFGITYKLYILDDAVHEDYPDQCYHEHTRHPWSVNVYYRWKGECKSYYCSRPGTVVVRDCGVVVAPDSCKIIGQDLQQHQPFCCPIYECTRLDGSNRFTYNPLAPNENDDVTIVVNDGAATAATRDTN